MRWLFLFGGIGLLLLVVFMGDVSKTADPAETSEEKTDVQNNAKTVSNKLDGLLEPEKVKLFVSGARVNVRSGPGVRFQTHNQNMAVAASAIAERNTFGHLS